MPKANEVQVEFMDDVDAIVTAHKALEAASAADDDAMARIAQWIASGSYPNNQTIIAGYIKAGYKKGTASVYASAILKWVKAGQVPKGIRQAVTGTPKDHVKGPAGRKAGQGAGKTTKPEADDVDALPEVSALPKEWLRFLEGMRAKVPGFKTWTASDIAAFQDSSAALIALIKRNA